MQTEEDCTSVTLKKKNDNKGQHTSDNNSVVSQTDSKKGEKSDGEDPKPRIVLTFRSEKSGAKSSNMKIVPNDEKHEECSPRRSSRTRGKWEWSDEADSSASPKKDKDTSQPVSENDEGSDSSRSATASKRPTRRGTHVPYETPTTTQRLSRRIKPTAKILANEELRIGLESQNNARLGIQIEKPEDGVKTRRSARPTQSGLEQSTSSVLSKKDTKNIKAIDVEEIVDDDSNSEDKQDPSTVMKLKHLCELGLKAINTDSMEEENDDEMEVDEEVDEYEEEEEDEVDLEDEDEMDDDSEEVISKLLEADEDSSEDFLCTLGSSKSKRPRRSTRLCSSYGGQDVETQSPLPEDDDQKEYCPPSKRNRSRRRVEHSETEQEDEGSRSRRLKSRAIKNEDVQSEAELEDNNSEPAGGDEGTEAACPDDESTIVATCYCETPSNVHAAPSELTEPVFCQAVETVDGARVGCSHAALRARDGALEAMLRAGPRSPYLLTCRLHAAQLRRHMACPACGLFCTQGIFYQCSLGHLFHLECGLPYNESVKPRPGCPHCGVRSYRWQPVNTQCHKVKLRMQCSNKRVYLPDQREQCTQAYLSFSSTEPPQTDQMPLIPDDLLPAMSIDLKSLCLKKDDNTDPESVIEAAQKLCDAIIAMEPVEQLISKITCPAVVNEQLPSLGGGSSVHAAATRGYVAALHALRCAGADIDALDNGLRTPLMAAIHALLVKPENKIDDNNDKTTDKDITEESDIKEELEPKEVVADVEEDKKDSISENKDSETVTALLDKTDTDEENKKSADKEILEDIDIKQELRLNEETTEKQDLDEEKKDSISEKKEDEIEKGSDEDLMKCIRYLIAAGCDVNIQGPEGMTALHMGAQHGNVTVCEMLLRDGGAFVEPRDHGGWSPLVWAAEHRHPPALRLLLANGADAATRDSEGNGAIHWCALAGSPLSLKLLLDAAPHTVHHHNAHHDTPLHIAARQGHYACVIILLARGAKTDVENSAGELPADVCTGACQTAIALNMHMAQITGNPTRCKILSSDISNGLEEYPVPCVNEVDDEPLPTDFTYVTSHLLPEPVAIDDSIATMKGCDCVDVCGSNCACVVLSVRMWWSRGKLIPAFPHHDPPMLFECNQTCACNKRKCENMVVSRIMSRGSLGVRAEVFRTLGRGWGLRAASPVPRGAAAALYCGELLPLSAADTRAVDRYMFALDLKPDLLQQCNEKTLLCVDACRYGSAARFVNHSCSANLAPVRVFPQARDLRLPAIVLFATRDIRAGEELTFDYGDKFWQVKSKFMKCECATPECRYPEKSTESDS
ncbi:unnamed protein product [Chilo suppressalis]|uniref:SET domain-containing protein n=1 Tax=Chilo suppressalis TaxID=168631 RepID=A0ABN8L6W7_CHISP|nr:unnamed protein product [Chilo suppressalis]